MFNRKLLELTAVNNYSLQLLMNQNNKSFAESMKWYYNYLRNEIKDKELRKILDDIHKNQYGWCIVDNDEKTTSEIKSEQK